MAPFETYIRLGFQHIADVNAYDHMLFLLALVATYTLREWKSVLILVTAFTIGHSLTLALSALDAVNIDSQIIEFLIPVTIFFNGHGKHRAARHPKKEKSKPSIRFGVTIWSYSRVGL